jgi:hypothetical protein
LFNFFFKSYFTTMQFSQIFATFALAVATATASAIPQTSSFSDTMAKIKLAHPGISDDAAYDSTVGFMDAVMQLQTNVTIHVSSRPIKFFIS